MSMDFVNTARWVLPEQCGRQGPAQAGALVDLLEAQVLEPGFFASQGWRYPVSVRSAVIFTHRGQRSDAVCPRWFAIRFSHRSPRSKRLKSSGDSRLTSDLRAGVLFRRITNSPPGPQNPSRPTPGRKAVKRAGCSQHRSTLTPKSRSVQRLRAICT